MAQAPSPKPLDESRPVLSLNLLRNFVSCLTTRHSIGQNAVEMISAAPEPGQVVFVRQRPFVVSDVRLFDLPADTLEHEAEEFWGFHPVAALGPKQSKTQTPGNNGWILRPVIPIGPPFQTAKAPKELPINVLGRI